MRITVCPIKKLKELSANESTSRIAIISTSDVPEARYLPSFPYALRIYEDIDRDLPNRSFSHEDAEAFADFFKCHSKDSETVYVCCDAGESRSPAIAAALLRYLGMEDLPIWQNPRYHPNMLVYVMLCEALGITVTDEEIDLRLYENMTALRRATEKADK